MMCCSAAVFGAVALFMVSAPLSAKGDMVLIEVKGGTLTTPVKITDSKIQEFTVWAGPGVNGAGLANADGFIIDWQRGVLAEPPAGLQDYEVSFYAGCRTDPGCMAEPPSLVYVVRYEYDPSSKRGFVYLPGKGEALYGLNTRTIWHGPGVEGHWFVAADSWERFVGPLIVKALGRSR